MCIERSWTRIKGATYTRAPIRPPTKEKEAKTTWKRDKEVRVVNIGSLGRSGAKGKGRRMKDMEEGCDRG